MLQLEGSSENNLKPLVSQMEASKLNSFLVLELLEYQVF